MTMDAMAQKATIEFLDKTLAEVKSGKITGLLCVLLQQDGQLIHKAGGPQLMFRDMVTTMAHAMRDEAASALRPQQQSSLVRAGSIPRLPGLNGAN